MTGGPALVVNRLRGEFAARIGGEALAFDTSLGTVAIIEERCGGVSIVEAINKAVFGRRAADQMALIAGALMARGHADPEAFASRSTAVEAEAFILALMGALGFEILHRGDGPATIPFDATPDPTTDTRHGAAGEALRSEP